MSGILYIVPTPIGNLGDISERSLSVLKQVSIIACEDTRHSGRLLQHYDITTETISLHQHNEQKRSEYLTTKLLNGVDIALISDAGTPLINDPGFELVRQCRRQHINVIALPGPCAFVTALSASGIATDKFCFAGFVPVKRQARQQTFDEVMTSGITYVFYESPKRILSTLETINESYPDVHVMIGKELTKTHENYIGNTASEIIDWLMAEPGRLKGEFVLMIKAEKAPAALDMPEQAIRLLNILSKELPPKKAASIVADHYELNKKKLYQMLILD